MLITANPARFSRNFAARGGFPAGCAAGHAVRLRGVFRLTRTRLPEIPSGMANSEIDTVLGEDISFRGKLQFKKSLQINGKFKGSITTGGHLIIGPGARVEADIEAGDVSVEGQLQGNVTATRQIDLLKNARIRGDLRTPDLQIASGSRFSGNCIMD